MDQNEALAQMAAVLGPVAPEVVACGIVVSCWRDPMEPFHRVVGDHEMAYMNIATTRAVAEHCSSSSVDWPAVRKTMLDPERVVLPGRSVVEVVGDDWDVLRADLAERLDEAVAMPALLHAGWAHLVCRDWWGMPSYADQVAGLLETGRVTRWAGTPAELGEALVNDPMSVPLEVWEQIVGGNGLGWLDVP